MIPDLDIWRAAVLLLKEHGERAELVAAKRSADMLVDSDMEGRAVWMRIREAIVELQAKPKGPAH